jgi:putative ABC transport system substrate-binding protein
MRRREVLALFAGAAAWPRVTRAQAAKVWRIGQVTVGAGVALQPLLPRHLASLGYADGQAVTFVDRAAPPAQVREVIRELRPQIDLLAVWSTIGAVAAKDAAPDMPTVFLSVGDPVRIGLVKSLAQPGGHMTGITFEATMETYGKRLQILKQIVPDLKRVAVLRTIGDANVAPAMAALEEAAGRIELSLLTFDFASTDELATVFQAMRPAGAEALLVVAGAQTFVNGDAIAKLALANRLPSSHGFRETVMAGGLLSIGPDFAEMARQAAVMITKIMGGAKPADLPVEQPTKYTLAINAQTAQALNLTIPSGLLASADEVIE